MAVEYLRDSDSYVLRNLHYGERGGSRRDLSDSGSRRQSSDAHVQDDVHREGLGTPRLSAPDDKMCLDLYLPGSSFGGTSLHCHHADTAPSQVRQRLPSSEHSGKNIEFPKGRCRHGVVDHEDGFWKSCLNDVESAASLGDIWPLGTVRQEAMEDVLEGSSSSERLHCRTSGDSLPPLAIFVHGGGWRRGDRKAWRHYVSSDDTNLLVALVLWATGLYGNVGADLASRGIACAVISYPLASPTLPVFLFELILSYLSGLVLLLALMATGGGVLIVLITALEAVTVTMTGLGNAKILWNKAWATHANYTGIHAQQNFTGSNFSAAGTLPAPALSARAFLCSDLRMRNTFVLSVLFETNTLGSFLGSLSALNVLLATLCAYNLVLLAVIGTFRRQYRLGRSHVVAMATVAVATVASFVLIGADVVHVRKALLQSWAFTLLLVHLPQLYTCWGRTTSGNTQVRQQLEAVARAVGWLQRFACQRALYDPGRSVLIGHSAGGHLVSLLGLDAPLLTSSGCSPRHIKAVIAVSGIYDLLLLARTAFLRHFYLHPAFGRDVTHWEATSPLQRARCLATNVHRRTPAFLLVKAATEGVSATADSDTLHRLLQQSGCCVRHVTVPACNHFTVIVGLGTRRLDKDRTLLDVIVDFVWEHT